jgi:hypothetical protein
VDSIWGVSLDEDGEGFTTGEVEEQPKAAATHTMEIRFHARFMVLILPVSMPQDFSRPG